MSERRQVAALLEQAERYRLARNWHGAMELLKKALALDPEHAQCHASLALVLLGARRVHGADVEAGLALHFGTDDAFCHYAKAAVCRAQRKLADAYEHCLIAMQQEGVNAVDARVLAAVVRSMQGDVGDARRLLDEALAIEPDHAGVMTELARLELREGRPDEAFTWIDKALRADPSRMTAHVVAGFIALRRGDDADAERHARTALTADASSDDALQLWTALKARRSVLLGMWWRINAFVTLRSERRQLAILIGSFVLVRLAIIVTRAADLDDAAEWLSYGWLGFCIYTWVAPELFRKAMQRELKTVTFSDDY
jgi:Tfp pilus assembly protein PilF